MISICVTVKNRSRVAAGGRILELFPNCVRAIASACGGDPQVELVISDWHSDDWPLDEWLGAIAGDLTVRRVTVDGTFARGRGRNLAAAAATGDQLLFLDADCLIQRTMLARGSAALAAGQAYFPVVFSYHGPEHTTGWWRHEGFGNCMVSRTQFDAVGGWPDYPAWGREDDDFHAKIAAIAPVLREEAPGLLHQWHPNDVLWKDRYTDRPEHELAWLRAVAAACAELQSQLPPNVDFILIDEATFGHGFEVLERAWPFPERDGDYQGPPADGATALAELLRMQRRGARYVAIAWNAQWWLQHYRELAEFLERCAHLQHHSEHLRIYRLHGAVEAAST